MPRSPTVEEQLQVSYAAAITQRDRYRKKAERLVQQLEQAEQRARAMSAYELEAARLKAVIREHWSPKQADEIISAALTTPDSSTGQEEG